MQCPPLPPAPIDTAVRRAIFTPVRPEGRSLDLLREPIVIHLIMAALSVWPLMRIAERAGRARWPAWLMFVPMVGPPLAVTLLLRGPWPNHPDPPRAVHPRTGR